MNDYDFDEEGFEITERMHMWAFWATVAVSMLIGMIIGALVW